MPQTLRRVFPLLVFAGGAAFLAMQRGAHAADEGLDQGSGGTVPRAAVSPPASESTGAIPRPARNPDALAVPTDSLLAPPAVAPGLSSTASLSGSVGLLHASTADVGPVHQVRLGLHGEYFGADSFLIEGDSNQRLAGSFVFGYTLRRDIELFGAILNSSNRNKRTRATDDRDPELIKTFGDLLLGGKWILPLSPAATLGAEVGLKFLAGVSDLAVSPGSTSWWLGPLFTYDLRRAGGIPLRFHAGASYYADNSSNLHALKVPAVTRHTKEAAMFAYGMAPSRLRLALAVDAPLDDLFPQFPIDPFIEYHVAYVTADADLDFADFMSPSCRASDPTRRPCIDNRDMQWLTLGARANVFRGVTVDLGLDIRVRSAGFPYGPPIAPWNLMFGVSYPLDLDSLTRTVVVTRTIEKTLSPGDGTVVGVVRSAQGGAPIDGAIVAVMGRPRARVASDPDGAFQTTALPPGLVELAVTAPNFDSAKVAATVVAGQSVDVAVALEPRLPAARVHGRVTAPTGKGLAASVRFAGGEIREASSDASGDYSASLPAGVYQVRAAAAASAGLRAKEAEVELVAGQDKQLDFILRALVVSPSVVLSGDSIKLKGAIRFVGATARLDAASEQVLDALADLLDGHGEIRRVRIIAHWDGGLPKPAAATLTQQQAESVRAYLLRRGIVDARLVAEGAGSTRPLVPNLTPMNRARNRRVELKLE